jgi:LysM repeat protein
VATVVVAPGDTLWDIAAEVLGTNDSARIAAYWPVLYRVNRSVVSDPDALRPGWVLVLPDEDGEVTAGIPKVTPHSGPGRRGPIRWGGGLRV